MADAVFPERQRCKRCRRIMGQHPEDPVLFGLYCAPQCAGISPPAKHPEEASRECTMLRRGRRVFRRVYRAEHEIPEWVRKDASTSWYTCSWGHIHIGHRRLGESQEFRVFNQAQGLTAQLSDLLIRLRGGATHQQVAMAAGVRLVRLRELEEGTANSEYLTTLEAVLRAYQVRLGVTLPTASSR